MACRGCGDAVYMTKDQVENYINKLIADGTLQPGLVGCDGNALPKGSKVAGCGAFLSADDGAALDKRIKTLEELIAKFEQLNTIAGEKVGLIHP